MKRAIRHTALALITTAMVFASISAFAAEIVIDSGESATIISSLPDAVAQEEFVCSDTFSGQLGSCPEVPAGEQGPQGPEGPEGPEGPAGPAGGMLAYAHVNADGTIDNDSGNITVSTNGGGSYCVGVTGGTVHVVIVSLDHTNTGGYVQAGVFRATDCVASGNDDIQVITRDLSQTVGFPGTPRAFYIIVN